MAHILLLNGPNLNLLGTREPAVYGSTTLQQIEEQLAREASTLGHRLSCLQSNAEHVLIDKIQAVPQDQVDILIINPAAYSHTSVALRDAISAVKVPFVEIHMSNVYAREPFRKHSYFSDIAIGVISGFGAKGYSLALQAADHYLSSK